MPDCNHIYSVLATIILETLAPTHCVACDDPGSFLCPTCADELPFIDPHSACPRCGAPYGYFLCTCCPIPDCEETRDDPGLLFPFEKARCAVSFENVGTRVVRAYKDEDELRLSATIASFICAAARGRTLGDSRQEALSWAGAGAEASRLRDPRIPEDWTQWADALAYVPASPKAVLRRDFDHMERVALLCAQRMGLPLRPLLTASKRVADQRGLGRGDRARNRRGSFGFVDDGRRVPERVLLIDDVFTTGATLRAATEVLLDAGVREVRAVAFARVW